MNGVAERFNLTACNSIRAMLESSHLPSKFWSEALMCFNYVWNRVPHRGYLKTPFELYSGNKPSVAHLKVFGCLAYVGTPKQHQGKLDARVKLGIMVGYAQLTKVYRIWLEKEQKIVETVNVNFDENTLGVELMLGHDFYEKRSIKSGFPMLESQFDYDKTIIEGQNPGQDEGSDNISGETTQNEGTEQLTPVWCF
jgi:hypothetical protein